MADKTFIPESCLISKNHGKTQFYDRNGNIASLPNKQVKVFDDNDGDQDHGWNHPQAGGGSGEPEGADMTGVDPNAEGAAEIEQTLDEGGDPGPEGDAVLDALDRANDAEAVSDESGEVAAAAPATKSKSKRGSGKSGGKTMATAKAKAAAPKKAAAKKASVKVVAQPKKVNGQGTGLLRSIKGRVHDISGYVKSKNASGHVSYDNGDDVAEKLRGKDLDQVYDLVAKAVKEDVKALKAKYKHLNVGMQRMSLGNRLRKVNRAKAEKAAAAA